MSNAFPPFSAAARAEHLASLTGERWDVLVIGGGITGAAIARDAAGRGLRTALVEADDFARGTSSRSSRLIHGGLRYLETGDLRLVFEASAERRRLLSLAPHLVHPQEFLFPVFRGGGLRLRTLQAGMWLYDGLSLFRNIKRHRMLTPADIARDEPALRTEGLKGAAVYHDASVDDARLTLANARGAHEAGAATVSHAEVVGFLRDATGLTGVRLRDRLKPGTGADVHARVVVNATGPWSDELRRLADPAVRTRLRPTKGVHIMVHSERIGNRHAITFRSPIDNRVMFVLPWGDLSYVGTTDTDYRGAPGDARADASDVRYLLESANAIYPAARLTEEDVLSTWAGVRPLLSPPEAGALGGKSESETSREHEIWRDRSGLLNVAGGKLTTYRVMAGEATDVAARFLRREHGVRSGDSLTPDLPLPGAPADPWPDFQRGLLAEATALGLWDEVGTHLARAYGEDARLVLDLIRGEVDLGERLVPSRPYVWAEVLHAVRSEMALTLPDVLERRLHLFHEVADGGLTVADAVARRIAGEPGIGWDAAEIERQVGAYREAVAATRGFRA